MRLQLMKRPLTAALAVLALASAARATWSIVIVNHRTGEVGVASATCIGGFDLKPALCVLRVGEGAAAAQSVIDQTGVNRMTIWNELQNGTDPDQILNILAAGDTQHQRRQYGIVSLRGGPTTFTGTQCGNARFGVSGTTGDLSYAIQGNILTGTIVVTNAEQALLASSGDLPTRMMAAMLAARDMGGDGRCSCSQLTPQACGAPPPEPFYSAATAFMVIARLGDQDGTCNAGQGCANGQYWCDLRVIDGPPNGQDPVVRMANQAVPFWRGSLAGRADHLLTRVTPSAQVIPADGASSAVVDVELRNIDDQPIDPFQPQLVIQSLDAPGSQVAVASPAIDLGGGRLRFTLTSNGQVGNGRWQITVTQGDGSHVRLWPNLEVRADVPTPLFCGFIAVSATAGATVPLTLDLGTPSAGVGYLVLGTSSGTVPGFVFQGVHLPLNRDRFLVRSFARAGLPPFPGTIGALDASGRAAAGFVAGPGALVPLVGRRIDWAAVIGPAPSSVTNVVGFDVAP